MLNRMLIIFFLSISLLKAENIQTVGTGKTYTTVAAWFSNIATIVDNEDQTGELTGLAEDNSAVYFDGIDNSSNWITLRAASGQEADGTDAAGAQVDVVLVMYEATNQANVRFQSIEFHTVGTIDITFDNAACQVEIIKCVFRDDSGVSAISMYSGADTAVRIGACLFRDITTSFTYGININDANITTECKVYNCTFYNVYTGMREDAGDFTDVKNCVSICNEVNAGYTDYASVSNMSYCASSDLTATGTGSINTAARADEWTDYSTDDFSVKNTSAHIYHTGTAISGESWFPSTGIGGNVWFASTPSMGSWEFPLAAPSGTPTTKPKFVPPTNWGQIEKIEPRGLIVSEMYASN